MKCGGDIKQDFVKLMQGAGHGVAASLQACFHLSLLISIVLRRRRLQRKHSKGRGIPCCKGGRFYMYRKLQEYQFYWRKMLLLAFIPNILCDFSRPKDRSAVLYISVVFESC